MTILFAGDFCPINRTEQLALEGKADSVLGDLLAELNNKDLSIVTLECPLTKTNSPIPKIGPNLRARPEAVQCIKAGRFDIVNLANNHIADYGSFGLNETMSLLQSNKIQHVGAGSSLSSAQNPLHVQCRGSMIAFLAFAENEFGCADEEHEGAWPLNPVVNIRQIRKAKANADIVIVLVHGGNEYSPVPSPRIVETYRAFVDAGASAVIATHPHVPQGYEIYNNAPVFYSLGNFVFDWPQGEILSPLWSKSYMIRLRFRNSTVEDVDIIPYKAVARTGCLTLLGDRERDEFLAYLSFLSRISRDDGEIRRYWHGWCALMGPKWLRWLSRSSPLALLYTALPSRRFISMKSLLATRALVTCEAYNEILSTFMDLVRKGQVETAKEYIPLITTLQRGKVPD